MLIMLVWILKDIMYCQWQLLILQNYFYKAPNQGIYPQINSKLQFFNYKTLEKLMN